MPDHFDKESMSGEIGAELNAIENQTAGLFRRTLIMWLIRWVIGFAIIGLVTWFKPEWSWLWWAGIAVAAASLAFTLVMQFVMQRNMAEARASAGRLEAALADLDEDG